MAKPGSSSQGPNAPPLLLPLLLALTVAETGTLAVPPGALLPTDRVPRPEPVVVVTSVNVTVQLAPAARVVPLQLSVSLTKAGLTWMLLMVSGPRPELLTVTACEAEPP